jgi:hypothetical protein
MMLSCVLTEMIPGLVVPLEEEDAVVAELLEDVVVPDELLTEAVLVLPLLVVAPPALVVVELPPLLVVTDPPALVDVVPAAWPPVPVAPDENEMPGCDPHPAAIAVVPAAARRARRAQRTATIRSMARLTHEERLVVTGSVARAEIDSHTARISRGQIR